MLWHLENPRSALFMQLSSLVYAICEWFFATGWLIDANLKLHRVTFKRCYSLLGRPLKGQNIPGCSAVISRRLHFWVLYGINQFQNQSSRIWNWFEPESFAFFSTLLWKPVSKPVSFIWNRFIPESTQKSRWSEIAPEHPTMFRPMRRRSIEVPKLSSLNLRMLENWHKMNCHSTSILSPSML